MDDWVRMLLGVAVKLGLGYKVLRSTRMWERLVAGCVIEEFHHKEVEAKSHVMPPPSAEMASLFAEPRVPMAVKSAATSQEQKRLAKRNAFLEKTKRVKDEKKFSAFTPESEQDLVAEMRFMRVLREGELWHKASDVWVTGLLPKGHLIHFKAANIYTWVVKTYSCSAICWPAELVCEDVWQKARKISEVQWHTVFDLEDVEVLPTAPVSLMHLFVQE